MSSDRNRRIRTIEIRHESFENPAFIILLRMHRVISDAASKWPKLQDVTGGFVYMRLHGDKVL